eukprot:4442299-Pyramimonas_sp.AAC.1
MSLQWLPSLRHPPRGCIVGHVGPVELVVTNNLDVTLCEGDLDPRNSIGIEAGPSLPAPRPTE